MIILNLEGSRRIFTTKPGDVVAGNGERHEKQGWGCGSVA